MRLALLPCALPLSLSLAACAEGPPPLAPAPAEATSARAGPVVYGVDDRLEWYQFPDETLRDRLRASAVVQVRNRDVDYRDDGTVSLAPGPTLGQAADLCADQLFRDQPTSGSCSGALIDRDLVLTAGHCVSDAQDCEGAAFVFDFLYESEGVRPPLGPEDVYRCARLLVDGDRHIPGDLDLAIVQLDRPVEGRTPLPVAFPAASAARPATRPALALGEPLVMAGFPSGIPLKIDAGGSVSNPRLATGDYFVATVDAFHGNSGSPVLDSAQAIVGVLTSGADDYTARGTCSVVTVLPDFPGREGVHYAHHAVTALCGRGFPSAALCPGSSDRCGDGFCSNAETFEACPADCGGAFAVPDGWTCSPSWYGVRDDCDCDCGIRDPDCDNPNLRILNCARGSRCDALGQCTVPLPETWACNPDFYNAGDDCDCSCGAWDPDCARADLRTVGCRAGGACLADGTCSNPAPDGWTCADTAWDNNNACHCDCGAPDPDCGLPGRSVIGCAPGSACQPDGTCEAPFPDGWVCPPEAYGSNGRCDCNCGAWDPDCATSTAAPLNCPAGHLCDDAGGCLDPASVPPDVGPEPGPEEAADAPVAEEPPEAVADAAPDAGEADILAPQGDAVEADAPPEPEDGASPEADTGASGADPDARGPADVRSALIPGQRVAPDLGCGAGGGGSGLAAGLVSALVGLLAGRSGLRRQAARRQARRRRTGPSQEGQVGW